MTPESFSNAAKWAREVEEYRPYPDDPTWAKLRKELAKYNPADGVVDAIIAVLAPWLFEPNAKRPRSCGAASSRSPSWACSAWPPTWP